MRTHVRMCATGIIALLIPASLCGQTGPASTAVQSKPRINITVIPPMDPGGPNKLGTIAGTVTGAESNCRVVIFAHTNVWYVQPYIASPFTSIEVGGKWLNETHLGAEYAALLVTSDYRPPSTTSTLPREGGAILAIARVRGKEPFGP